MVYLFIYLYVVCFSCCMKHFVLHLHGWKVLYKWSLIDCIYSFGVSLNREFLKANVSTVLNNGTVSVYSQERVCAGRAVLRTLTELSETTRHQVRAAGSGRRMSQAAYTWAAVKSLCAGYLLAYCFPIGRAALRIQIFPTLTLLPPTF